MLSLSGKGNLAEKLKPLNIRPVCISYEWEPCDIQKVKELYISSRQTYVKSKDEDLESIIGGITGQKGHVHYAVGNSLNNAIDKLPHDLSNNERLQKIVSLIDIEMFNSYRLWPNNFLALDLLNNSREFQNHYDTQTEKAFEEKTAVMLQKLQSVNGNPEELIRLFRALYAKPLQNKLENNLPLNFPR
jgi:hypothetical protein